MSNYFLNIRLSDSKKENSLVVEQSLTETTANIVGTSYRGPAYVPQKIFSRNLINDVEVYNTLTKTLGNIRQNSFGHLYDEYTCYINSLAYNAIDFWISNGGTYCSFTRVLGIGNGVLSQTTGKMIGSGFNAENNISYGTLTQTKNKNINSVDSDIKGSVSFVLKSLNEISKRSLTVSANQTDVLSIDYLNELGFYRDSENNALNLNLQNASFISDVLITPQGILPSLEETIDENKIYTYEDVAADYSAQTKVLNDKNQFFVSLKGFKPYLFEYSSNLNNASSYYQDDFGRNLNFIDKQEIYSNPDKNYFSNRFLERGHLVYATFPFGGLNDSRKNQNYSILTTKPYSELNNNDLPDYNSFESEFTTAKTPWVTSQPLNRKGLENNRESIHDKVCDLFRFWSLDDGDVGNRFRIKINLVERGEQNINTDYSNDDIFSSFDIYIFEYDARINQYIFLESYTNTNLNPESKNYIGRVIGTKRTYYDFNANKVVEEGKFKNKSNFLRVEIAKEIDEMSYKNHHELLPSGFKSYPYIKLDKSAFENQFGSDINNMSIYQLPPLYKLNDYKEYSNSSQELTDHLNDISWGVLFNDAIVKNNKISHLSTDIMTDKVSPHFYYTKYFLNSMKNGKNIWVEEDNYLNSFFHLEKIIYKKTEGVKNARYKHSGRASSDSDWDYLNLSNNDVWESNRELKSTFFKDQLSFDFFTYGGFNGVDIRDKDKFYLNNDAILREEYDDSDEKSTQKAYLKAIDIATDDSNCSGDILLTPGISAISIIDSCIEKCESNKKHFYVADIKSSYSNNLISYTDPNNGNKLLHTSLGISGQYYYIENVLCNYTFNQIKYTTKKDINDIVNYTKIIKENTENVLNKWKDLNIESRYLMPVFGDILSISSLEEDNSTFDKLISPEVYTLGKIANTVAIPRVSLTSRFLDINSSQSTGNISYKIIDNENLHEAGINFDNIEKLARESRLNLIFKPKNNLNINLLSDNTSYENRKSIFQKQSIVRTLQEIKKRIKFDIFLNESIFPGGFWFTQNSNFNNVYDKLKIQIDSLMQLFLDSGYVSDYLVKIDNSNVEQTILDMQNYTIRGNIIIQFEESDIISLRLDEILSDLSLNTGDMQDSVFIPRI